MFGRVIAGLLAVLTIAPAYAGQVLEAEAVLYQNQYLSTRSGLFSVVMQSDGNFVRYFTPPNYPARTGAGWGHFATNTDNGSYIRMQADGNLAMYTSGHSWAWTSNSGGNPIDFSYKLVLREDGALVIMKGNLVHKTLSPHDAGGGSGAYFPFRKYVNGQCVDSVTTFQTSGYTAVSWAQANGGTIGYCGSSY